MANLEALRLRVCGWKSKELCMLLLSISALWQCTCSSNEEHDYENGIAWCVDNVLYYNPSDFSEMLSGFPSLRSLDCSEYGAVCKEVTQKRTIAGCILSDEPCPTGMYAICFKNSVARCSSLGFPELQTGDFYDCEAKGLFCIESHIRKTANCAYFPDKCSPEGAARCASDNTGNYYTCNTEAWMIKGECQNGSKCVQISDEIIDCIGSAFADDSGADYDGQV
jgi:hypothetical protein